MRGWGWWVLVLLSSGCAHRLECREHGGGEVVRLATEHFEVVSTLPVETTRLHASRLERLWGAFSAFFGHTPAAVEPLRVVLLDDDGAEEFAPEGDGFVGTVLRPLVLTSVHAGDGRAWTPSVHALVHLLSPHWLPRQPRWIAEGLADYLGGVRFEGEAVLRFGRGVWPGGRVADLDRLWDWDRASGSFSEERDRYASAWAYLSWFADRDGERLARLWAAMRDGTSARAGFESVVPASEWPALQRAVQAWVDDGRFSGWQSPPLPGPALGKPTALAAWELHALRGEVLSSLQMTRAAVADFTVAEGLAPRPVPTVVALGLLGGGPRGPRRTDALLELARAPDAPVEVFLELAAQPDLAPDERLRFAEEGLARAPLHAGALAQIAERALLVPGRIERALAASEALTRQAPWAFRAWLLHAQTLAAASRCQAAQRALDAAESVGLELARARSARILRERNEVRTNCREAP